LDREQASDGGDAYEEVAHSKEGDVEVAIFVIIVRVLRQLRGQLQVGLTRSWIVDCYMDFLLLWRLYFDLLIY